MSRKNSPSVRVLIVDDERLIRWSLAQTLVAAGATVVEAAIRRLRPTTRVLLMTAYGTEAVMEEARALGALAVVDKPFELHAMADLILGATPAG